MAINKNLAKKIIADLPKDPAARLVAWNDVKGLIADLKKVEAALRKEALDEFFAKREEGTTNVELGHDWKARCKQPVTRKLDPTKFDAVFEKLPRGFRQKLIKMDAKLVVGEYTKLSDEHREIFDEAVTMKNGTASLELLPPKTVEL